VHAGRRIAHEVDDQLGQRVVERRVGEGQRLRGRDRHVDARQASAARVRERHRRVDRRHPVGPEQTDELGRHEGLYVLRGNLALLVENARRTAQVEGPDRTARPWMPA
jgi:hypothetical protein